MTINPANSQHVTNAQKQAKMGMDAMLQIGKQKDVKPVDDSEKQKAEEDANRRKLEDTATLSQKKHYKETTEGKHSQNRLAETRGDKETKEKDIKERKEREKRLGKAENFFFGNSGEKGPSSWDHETFLTAENAKQASGSVLRTEEYIKKYLLGNDTDKKQKAWETALKVNVMPKINGGKAPEELSGFKPAVQPQTGKPLETLSAIEPLISFKDEPVKPQDIHDTSFTCETVLT